MQQATLFPNEKLAYGGELLNTRQGRAHGRPLSTRATMHFVLRSSQATGERSFRRPRNALAIRALAERFARKWGVNILGIASPGNHIHLHLKLQSRHTYPAFIRALTAAIALFIAGRGGRKFWDYRPFSRVVKGRRGFLAVKDYVQVNLLEELGYSRAEARAQVAKNGQKPKAKRPPPNDPAPGRQGRRKGSAPPK